MKEHQFDYVENDFVTYQAPKTFSDKERIENLERKVDLLSQAIATQSDIVAKTLNDLAKIMGPGVSKELLSGVDAITGFIDTMATELEKIDGN